VEGGRSGDQEERRAGGGRPAARPPSFGAFGKLQQRGPGVNIPAVCASRQFILQGRTQNEASSYKKRRGFGSLWVEMDAGMFISKRDLRDHMHSICTNMQKHNVKEMGAVTLNRKVLVRLETSLSSSMYFI
jgi:hypothetical protein